MRVAIGTVACCALALVACGRSEDDPATEPDEPGRATALLVSPLHDGQVVRGDDGMDHIEYGLLVVSVFAEPVTLTSVVVLDSGGTELLRIEGDELAATTQTLLAKTPSPVIPASAAAGLSVDVIVPPDSDVDQVTHRITYALEPESPSAAMIDVPDIDGPVVDIERRAPIVISPPVQGDGWLATSACCSPNVHRDLRVAVDGRRIATPETFAVDWARVENDRLYDGDGTRNEQFYSFGADVRAVADGTVVAVQDDKPEEDPTAPLVPKTMSDYGGNQVTLEIAPNVFAWYAHLQPGSLQVEVGDVVEVGTPLARLGNTGPSLGPHLHFGLLDAPDAFSGRSLPFVLDQYTLVGTVDFETSEGDALVITPVRQAIEAAYPLYGGIQNFP